MNTEAARALVAPFYDALNQPATKDVRTLVESIVHPEWRSFAGESLSKDREAFIVQVVGFGKLIPDLTWELKEVVATEDKIVVRSEARGTPAGDFMGVPHAGRSFAIMTLDLHTVRDGRLVRADHVEDWALALRQLRG